ncbi:MAG: hypothetical protein EP299_01380, partial [Acidobacteria bacterium]
MRYAAGFLGVLLIAVMACAPGRVEESANGSGPAVEDIYGAWSGSMVHAGDSQPLALELEPAEDDKTSLRLTIPVMNLSRRPMGSAEPSIDGDRITLGPFLFTYDNEAQTLSGTMPSGFVPVYEIPFTLHRVEAVEALSRPEPTASLREPTWTFDAGAPLWAGSKFADGVLYSGDDQGRLHALDASSGAVRWSFLTGGPIRTRPSVVNRGVFFQADDGLLYRL